MYSHDQAIRERERYRRHFGVEPPDDLGKFDVWPMYAASFIRWPREADAGDEAAPEREALPGQFGLIPHWATDTTMARHTFNARSETVAVKPSFRDAWPLEELHKNTTRFTKQKTPCTPAAPRPHAGGG